MGKRIDYQNMIGRKFGILTVVGEAGKTTKYGPQFLCQCECGNMKVILGRSLIKGFTKSCGCDRRRHDVNYSDILGNRYGKLSVIKYEGLTEGTRGYKESIYLCRCDCGNEVIIPREQLVGDKRRSCGKCFKVYAENGYYRYACPDGQSFLFSACDYEKVMQKKWFVSSAGYVLSSEDGKMIQITTYLLRPVKGYIVDHINGSRFDNRRENLRIANISENNRNDAIQRNNTSGYKGVCYKHGKFEATICVDGKGIYLGRYNAPEEAARVYDGAARIFFGEFACVNFPMPGEQGCRRNRRIEIEESA